MNTTFAVISFVVGTAYLALAGLALVEIRQQKETRGLSRFGLAYVGMALSCGPHHFIHGIEAVEGFNVNWIVVLSLFAGLPAAGVFIGLRLEALAGGRADRHIQGTPSWLVAAAIGFCATAGGLVTAAALRLSGGGHLSFLAFAPNAFVTVTYSLVGLLLLRTQYLRRGVLGGWSLSGLSLGMIFPSCALMHLVYALTAVGDASICPADFFGIPASAYFLWVVHRLYRQAIFDWNRRPIAGAPQPTERPAPWKRSAADWDAQFRASTSLPPAIAAEPAG